MPTVSEILSGGIADHQAGRWLEAEAAYRLVLEMQPELAQAWYLFGGLAYQLGNGELAVQSIGRAVELAPQAADFVFDLGLILQEQAKWDAAAGCYRRAVELRPTFSEAHFSLGNVLSNQGKPVEAIESYRRAVALNPEYAEAHCNLGNALQDVMKQAEAIVCYRRSLELNPQLSQAHYNLGNAWKVLGNFDEAVACYRRALEIAADLAEAHNGLGAVYREQGLVDQAVESFRRACELNPALADAQCNLGTGLRDQGKLLEAIAAFRHAMEMKPLFSRAHSNLAYTLLFCPGYSAADIHAEHARWNELHAKPLCPAVVTHTNDRTPQRRLRIGYVSPDFRDHVQAFFTSPLFASHDHERFEIFCYSDVVSPDALTERLRAMADGWREIKGMSDEQVAELVRVDGIDILVDLTMHMERNRLLVFARKPAPVQVTWLAYPGTTGLTAIDYRLTDPWLDPPDAMVALGEKNKGSHYPEESIRLRDTFWCYDPLTCGPAVNTLPALDNGFITFGSLNVFCKMNAGVLKLWARVLQQTPRSRLVLLAPEGSCRQWAAEILHGEGIEPARIAFVGRQPRVAYLEEYQKIDIGLDTVPYNGHTTSLDALWMGVPVVTIVGQTVVGRAGLSQLSNLGLKELIAHSDDEFVRVAVELAEDLNRLGALRASLRQRMENSPLMDGRRFARNLEAAYRAMWQRWCCA